MEVDSMDMTVPLEAFTSLLFWCLGEHSANRIRKGCNRR